ncbi:hypothetical protein FQA39_LY10949 [Lamprigera yunnana]|nr:hypothetical protein FQA39_LY10949 [Lamprigera yunnana]
MVGLRSLSSVRKRPTPFPARPNKTTVIINRWAIRVCDSESSVDAKRIAVADLDKLSSYSCTGEYASTQNPSLPITLSAPSNCVLEGVPNLSAITTYELKLAINDTYRGELAVFKTRNIQRVKIKENKYFTLSWKNQILVLATADNFKNYEYENDYTKTPSISIELRFDCTQDEEKDLIIVQKINDTNNHAPRLSQTSFVYTFGMTIPKNFILTNVIPIKAIDDDISNGQIYFSISENDYFKVQHRGNSKSYSLKEFSTKLVSVKEVVAPFEQQFNVIASDTGNPCRYDLSTITVSVVKSHLLLNATENDYTYKSIFPKNLYYADYSPGRSLKIEQRIVIKHKQINSIIIKQKGYENYFNSSLHNSEVTLKSFRPLTFDIIQLDFIVIEVEAWIGEFIIGRTAIMLRLTKYADKAPCEIEGVEKSEWYHGKNLRQRVPDSQEGPFVQFSTKDIIGIRKQTSMYINATHTDNVLQLRPNLNFKYFEEDYKDEVTPVLDITITFNCVRNTSESIKFIARVEDVNNHAPIFNNDVYEYHFGMPIPEDYYLTDILPISVTDDDFTNHQIYFTMKYNTVLRVLYNGRTKYDDDKYFTTLKTLTEIKAPFREEFIIRATDSGTPPKKSYARIVITVSSSSQNKTINSIFPKRAYVANYHHEYLHLEDSVKLGISSNKLHLKQYGKQQAQRE